MLMLALVRKGGGRHGSAWAAWVCSGDVQARVTGDDLKDTASRTHRKLR